jgi:MOSC domain-containing protein YiiM
MRHEASMTAARGWVEAIHVVAEKGAPPRSVERVAAVAGLGLGGDRYAEGRGTFSLPTEHGHGRDLTLVEAEEIERLALDFGIELAPGETRRNVTTRGVRLNELVGRRFRIGRIECEGVRLCEPCTYLEGVTGKPIREPLRHRGGLRADIVLGGTIAVGDPIVDLGEAPSVSTELQDGAAHP